ncbi:MAG TPA: hypothetical protein VFK80_08835, partial [Limnochordia bacterium]|nr:hypothetical protein [Limnochordia bacterium]
MDAPRAAVRPLLQMQREDGAFAAIAGVDDWRRKRAHLREVFAWCLGTPAAGLTPPPVAYFVLDEHEGEGYRRLKIEYAVEADERVRAYLLIPHGLSGKAPGVLCLHGTAAEAKETQLGLPQAPGRDYGRHLAQRG